MRIAILAVALAAAFAGQAAAQTGFRCPETVTVEETPTVPPGTRAVQGRVERRFRAVEFFEGEYGDSAGALAPDSDRRRGNVVTQVFTFDARRPRRVYGRCAYRDSAAAIYIDVPPGVARCTLTFLYDQRTGAVGTTERPQQVECR